jgi:phosphoribosylglycinamide formyltransferase 1
MISIAVLGSTKGTDLQAIIDAIEAKELAVSIEVVISNKIDAYILERARKHGIKAVFVDAKDKSNEVYDADLAKVLSAYKIDVILLIGYMKILTFSLVELYRNKIINVHPSLLPKYGGKMSKDVHTEVLANKEKETGCTIHVVTEEVDAGPIIMQKKVKVEDRDTPESLKKKVQEQEGKALIEVLQLFDAGKIDIKDNEVVIDNNKM